MQQPEIVLPQISTINESIFCCMRGKYFFTERTKSTFCNESKTQTLRQISVTGKVQSPSTIYYKIYTRCSQQSIYTIFTSSLPDFQLWHHLQHCICDRHGYPHHMTTQLPSLALVLVAVILGLVAEPEDDDDAELNSSEKTTTNKQIWKQRWLSIYISECKYQEMYSRQWIETGDAILPFEDDESLVWLRSGPGRWVHVYLFNAVLTGKGNICTLYWHLPLDSWVWNIMFLSNGIFLFHDGSEMYHF